MTQLTKKLVMNFVEVTLGLWIATLIALHSANRKEESGLRRRRRWGKGSNIPFHQ